MSSATDDRSDLEAAVARLDSAMRNVPVGLAFFDSGLRFVHVNRFLADIHGHPPAEHLGRRLVEVSGGDARTVAAMEAHLQEVLDTRAPVADIDWSGRPANAPHELRHWRSSYFPVEDADGRLAGVGAVVIDVTERVVAALESRLLASATELVSSTALEDEVLRAASRVGVPEIASGCAIVVSDASDVLVAEVTCESAELASALRVGLAQLPLRPVPGEMLETLDLRGDGWAANAVPVLAPVREVLARHGVPEAICCPLGIDGQSAGLVIWFGESEPSGPIWVARSELFRRLAEKLGQALTRARLSMRADRAQARLALLANAGMLVAAQLDVGVRAGLVAQAAVPELASAALAFLVRDDGKLMFAGAASIDPAWTSRATGGEWEPVGHDPVLRLASTWSSAHLVPVGASDLLADTFEPFGAKTVLVLPLRDGGTTIGTMAFTPHPGRSFGDADLLLAEEMARLVVPALLNSLRFEQERVLGERLQRGLLPVSLPEVAGVRCVGRYLPATVGLSVGGDWYDVVPLPDGSMIAVIGDVVGHSIDAAIAMGRYRVGLRFAATGSAAGVVTSPAQLLEHLNRSVFDMFEPVMATALVLHVDPRAGRIVAASAGHLPPLAVAPGGSSFELSVPPGPPLGVRRDALYAEVTMPLEVGTRLLLYTDGLVERRDRGLDHGIDELRRVVDERAQMPESLADQVVARMLPHGAEDDVAVLSLRTTISGPRLLFQARAMTAELRPLRLDMRRWLENVGADRATIDDVVLAVNEAASNAVEHAYVGREPGRLRLAAQWADGSIRVEVADDGEWRRSPSGSHRGRGLSIIRAVMDAVEIVSDHGSRIVMTRSLPPADDG